jgi:hypothetical protein
MANDTNRPVDLEDGDELVPVTRETSRGGQEPPADVNDRPDQNVAYDEAVKGAPLTTEERTRAEQESPLAATDGRGLGDLDGNRTAGGSKVRGPDEP